MTSARAQQLFEAIRQLPRADRLRIVERVVHELAEEDRPSEPSTIIGLFAGEPDLMDAVCEDAMLARERDALRLGRA